VTGRQVLPFAAVMPRINLKFQAGCQPCTSVTSSARPLPRRLAITLATRTPATSWYWPLAQANIRHSETTRTSSLMACQWPATEYPRSQRRVSARLPVPSGQGVIGPLLPGVT
jgi:hypothetical protein